MVGQPTVTKPSRSDEVLDADQQQQITNQVRAQFESLIKTASLSLSWIIFNLNLTDPVVQEEFVETEYYKELDSIDKQHHTTGSGFIKVGSDLVGNDNYDLQLRGGEDGLESNQGGCKEMMFKTNPATNDWIPSLENYQIAYKSSKPNRSESS